MPDANETVQSPPAAHRTIPGWLFPTLRVLLVVAAGFLVW
jgi:nitrate reductase NapE component